MEWFFLVVLFTTPANFEPHVNPDFPRRTYETHQLCETNRKRTTDLLAARVKNPKVKFSVFCVRVSVRGWQDGVDNLRRATGEAS